MLQYAVPPGYQRQQPISGPSWTVAGVIDAILEDDKQTREATAHGEAIFERLRKSTGSRRLTIVKDYVRSAELHSREMFVP